MSSTVPRTSNSLMKVFRTTKRRVLRKTLYKTSVTCAGSEGLILPINCSQTALHQNHLEGTSKLRSLDPPLDLRIPWVWGGRSIICVSNKFPGGAVAAPGVGGRETHLRTADLH